MRCRQLIRNLEQLHTGDAQTRRLKSVDYLTGNSPLDTIGFHQDQRLFVGHLIEFPSFGFWDFGLSGFLINWIVRVRFTVDSRREAEA
jgi:hypothetical protein